MAFNPEYTDTVLNGLDTGLVLDYKNCSIWADYVYLDTTERRQFAQNAHEYLIEQQQTQSDAVKVGNNVVRLNFNHPVKFITWQLDDPAVGSNGYLAYDKAKIILNGTDRFQERERKYFSTYQIYKHWSTNAYFPDYTFYFNEDAIVPSVYSFALRPCEHQPSGTCNFSRIDTAQLYLSGVESSEGRLVVYATNYNVLRVMSGMGGLAYSN
jgi:hypothetical protein